MLKRPVSAKQAVEMIPDGAWIASGGFMASGLPEELFAEIERSFLNSGHPKDLSVFASCGQGDWERMGMQHLAHDGLLKRLIEGHLGACPKIGEMILSNRVQAYNLPIGIISRMTRSMIQNMEGELTQVGST